MRHFQFLADESGSATVWSLFWCLIFLALAGLSIDTSNAYRYKAVLQATADASSLGAINAYMNERSYQSYSGDLSSQTAPYRAAQIGTGLASSHMNVADNGTVVDASAITLGRWSGGSFNASGTPVNAARVVATRTSSSNNELPTLILGRLGLLNSWNVGATAVAEAYFNDCPSNEGIMAGGGLQIASRNLFQGDLCLHGENYLDLNNNNEFRANAAGELPGLSFGPPGAVCSGFGNCQTEGFTNVTARNVNLTADMITGPAPRMPNVAGIITDIQTVVANPAAFVGESDGRNHFVPKNLTTNPNRPLGAAATLVTATLPAPADLPTGASAAISNGVLRITISKNNFETAVQNAASRPLPPNAIYEVTAGCSTGNRRLDMTGSVTISDVVVVTSCRVLFSSNIRFVNSTLISTYVGSSSAIHGSSGVQLGGGDCANAEDGSLLVATVSDIDFAAGFQMNNSQVIGGADVDIAAQPNGMRGTSILAANDVRLTSNGEWQGCPFNSAANPVTSFVYKLVQ